MNLARVWHRIKVELGPEVDTGISLLVCWVYMLHKAPFIFVLSLKRKSGHRLHPSKEAVTQLMLYKKKDTFCRSFHHMISIFSFG